MQIRHALDVNLVLHALGANLTSHAPGTTAGVRPPATPTASWASTTGRGLSTWWPGRRTRAGACKREHPNSPTTREGPKTPSPSPHDIALHSKPTCPALRRWERRFQDGQTKHLDTMTSKKKSRQKSTQAGRGYGAVSRVDCLYRAPYHSQPA